MSDSMVTFVTRFDGTNAAEWFDAMKAYLQLKGLWLIVNGDYEKPEEVASSAELDVQLVVLRLTSTELIRSIFFLLVSVK